MPIDSNLRRPIMVIKAKHKNGIWYTVLTVLLGMAMFI